MKTFDLLEKGNQSMKSSEAPAICLINGRPGQVAHSTHKDDFPTSMIGLCQEGKSSPDALREERGCEFFSAFSASCWPLGRGFYLRE